MSDLNLPNYMSDHVQHLKCHFCLTCLATTGVLAVAVRQNIPGSWSLQVEVACGKCKKVNKSYTAERPLSSINWARQLAEATPRRRPRKPDVTPHKPEVPPHPVEEAKAIAEEAARWFYCVEKVVLDVSLAHFDADEGAERISVTFVTSVGDVDRPIAIRSADARLLATGLILCLASRGDRFARGLLDDRFQVGVDGRFHWPRPTE